MLSQRLSQAIIALSLGAAVFVLGTMAYGFVRDLPARHASRAEAQRDWPVASARWTRLKPALVRRLDQGIEPEFGAIWTMRGGRICGLVNGRHSFGGLTAMVGFYADGDQVVFGPEAPHDAFHLAWHDCEGDHWLVLQPGSTVLGFCGTALGAKRCYDL